MQLEGLILLLLIIVSIPIMILTSNHNIFFVLTGLVLIFFSLVNINEIFMVRQTEDENEDAEEFEGIMNIDSAKFTMGLEFAKELTIVLFYIYCVMYVKSEAIRILIASVIAYRVLDLAVYLRSKLRLVDFFNSIWAYRAVTLVINLCNLIIILPVAYNKFINPIF